VAKKKKKILTLSEALCAKCLECSGGVKSEVEFCCVLDCPLWPFRNGGQKELPVKKEVWDETIEIEE